MDLLYAGILPRFVALLIDSIICAVALCIVAIPVGALVFISGMRSPDHVSPMFGVLYVFFIAFSMLLNIGYEAYFIGAKGATPGKKIMKLKVTFPDGQYPIGYSKALVRGLVRLLNAFCLIDYIMALFDKVEYRTLHDRVAGTVVLKES